MFKFRDGWIIEDDQFSYESEYTKASVYALCNGYMGNRGTFEEMEAQKGLYVGNYVNGIYDAPGSKLREREVVNIQDWCSIRVMIDQEPFDLLMGKIIEFKRWINLKEAVLCRKIKWKSPKGKVITIESERFVSITNIHCGLIRWSLKAEDDCDVIIDSGVDANATNIHKYHFNKFSSLLEDDYLYLETVTKELSYIIGTACSDKISTSEGVKVQKKAIKSSTKYIFNRYRASLKNGDAINLQKNAVIYTSRDDGDPRINCINDLNSINSIGYDCVKEKHLARWQFLWKESDMIIEGDDKAQIGIRFSIYHLLNSAPYHSSSISYPARSLSGQDHRGSIFWDTEIFITPFFTYSMPEIAKNMLIYRYKTLDGARRKAVRLGYKGAYYAWESHETGDEKCHSRVFRYADTGRLMVNHFWDAQIHVSADIAYCIWQYYETTGDLEFLFNFGAEIVFEIARFFTSRVIWNKQMRKYVIKGVIGPDEYHEMIDNNAFTNAMAKESIVIALKVLELMKCTNNGRYDQLSRKIALTEDEIDRWKETKEKLFIQEPDEATGIIEQFSGYFKLENCSVKEALSRRIKPGEYLGGKKGICAKTQINKQADVIMYLYLLRDRFSDEVKKENWLFYEPRTEHGSSLSTMAYALVAADIGMLEWSYKYFLHSAFMDLEARGVYSNHGVHPCSLAGAWLTIVNGYSGITAGEKSIKWRKPHIPEKWKKISFKIKWHGTEIRFIYENGIYSAFIEKVGKYEEIPFSINGEIRTLTAENRITI